MFRKAKRIIFILKTLKTSSKFLLGAFLLAISIFIYRATASPPTSPYSPGETLAPTCSPGDTNCTVTTPAISGANSDITSLSGLTTPLSVSQGGTGSSTAAGARSNLGLEIGSDVQAYSAYLNDIADISPSQGDILYFDGTNWTRLAAGTSGQFLQTQGSGANPQWASALDDNDWTGAGTGKVYLSNIYDKVGIGTTNPQASLEITPVDTAALRINPYGTGSNNTGAIEFSELESNGSNYVGFRASDSIASNIIWTLPSSDGTNGQVLTTNGSGVLSWQTIIGTVADGTTNNSILRWDTASGEWTEDTSILADSSGNLTLSGNLTVQGDDLTMGTNLIFEGATADDFETTITVTDPTADRTITFPDSSGTVALTSDVSSHSLDDAYDAGGSGSGRSITADSGAVAISVPDGSNNSALSLTMSDTTNNPNVLVINNSSSGYSLLVDSGDSVFDEDLIVGGSTSRTETLANSGFSLGGDDLFVAGSAGIEGNVYTDGAFIAGNTLTLSDDYIRDSDALNFQPNSDTTNYLTLSSDGTDLTLTTTNLADLYIKPAGDKLVFQNSVDSTNGIQFLDSDGGTPVVNIDTENERVGIGTTVPGAKLEVSGTIYPVTRITRTTTGTSYRLGVLDALLKTDYDMQDGFGPGLTFSIQDNTAGPTYIAGVYAKRNGADDQGDLLFYTNDGSSFNVRMTLSQNGYLGVGTSDPQRKLHINSGTTDVVALLESSDSIARLHLKDSSTSNDYSVGISANGDDLELRSGSAGGVKMVVDSSGNVGIGTSSPDRLLQVGTISDGGSHNTVGIIKVAHDHNSAGGGWSWKEWEFGTGDATNFGGYDNFGFRNVSDNEVIMTFVGSGSNIGNVGIGTTNPEAKLSVKSTLNENPGNDLSISFGDDSDDYFAFRIYDDGIENYLALDAKSKGSWQSDPAMIWRDDGTVYAKTIYSTIVSGSYRDVYVKDNGLLGYLASLRQYKNNIHPLKADVDKILALEPVDFNWKESGAADVGLIAEDVEAVLPEMAEYDIDPETGEKKLVGVKYSKLPIYLLKAVKEQQSEINTILENLDLSQDNLSQAEESGSAVNASQLDDLVVAGALEVDGLVDFGPDTIGQAVVKPGDSEVEVKFEKEYNYTPIVVITKMTAGSLADYYVDEIDKSGFKIKINPVQGKDFVFSWHAFGAKNGLRIFSDGIREQIENQERNEQEAGGSQSVSGEVDSQGHNESFETKGNVNENPKGNTGNNSDAAIEDNENNQTDTDNIEASQNDESFEGNDSQASNGSQDEENGEEEGAEEEKAENSDSEDTNAVQPAESQSNGNESIAGEESQIEQSSDQSQQDDEELNLSTKNNQNQNESLVQSDNSNTESNNEDNNPNNKEETEQGNSQTNEGHQSDNEVTQNNDNESGNS